MLILAADTSEKLDKHKEYLEKRFDNLDGKLGANHWVHLVLVAGVVYACTKDK